MGCLSSLLAPLLLLQAALASELVPQTRCTFDGEVEEHIAVQLLQTLTSLQQQQQQLQGQPETNKSGLQDSRVQPQLEQQQQQPPQQQQQQQQHEQHSLLAQASRSNTTVSSGTLGKRSSHSAAGGSIVPGVLIFLFLLGFLGLVGLVVEMCWSRFQKLKKGSPDLPATFRDYLSYRFRMWVTRGESSKAMLIVGVCIVFLYTGTGLYGLIVGTNPSTAMFNVYKMILEPEAGYDQPTSGGRGLGILMSIGFLFVLAVLVAVVQDSVNNFLEHVRIGFSRVVEAQHILIIGFTQDTCTLIAELCAGYESEGGTTIVLLAEDPKDEIEEQLRRARIDTLNSTLVIRSGACNSIEHLAAVSAQSCRTVIILPHRRKAPEICDACTFELLLALTGKGWPTRGRILVGCAHHGNTDLFRKLGGQRLDIVQVNECVGKLMVAVSNQPGLGQVINSLFSFSGSELYIRPVPRHLEGVTFREAQFYFNTAILTGILHKDERIRSLCPDMDERLRPGGELVIMAEDVTKAEPQKQPLPRPQSGSPARHRQSIRANEPKVETIFILGWNGTLIRVLLGELESRCARGSKVVTMGSNTIEERKAWLDKYQSEHRKFENISVLDHAHGRLANRDKLLSLPVPLSQASRIFVVCDSTDEDAEGVSEYDAAVMTTVIMVNDILNDHSDRSSLDIPIVPEIRSTVTQDVWEELRIHDLVNSSGLPAQILACVAHGPKLEPVLTDVISTQGQVHFHIAKLSDYVPRLLPLPSQISFMQALHYVSTMGDILLGWTLPEDKASSDFHHRLAAICGSQTSFDLNPQDKMTPRPWAGSDRLVVITTNVPSGWSRG